MKLNPWHMRISGLHYSTGVRNGWQEQRWSGLIYLTNEPTYEFGLGVRISHI